jgi:hypothetical protein
VHEEDRGRGALLARAGVRILVALPGDVRARGRGGDVGPEDLPVEACGGWGGRRERARRAARSLRTSGGKRALRERKEEEIQRNLKAQFLNRAPASSRKTRPPRSAERRSPTAELPVKSVERGRPALRTSPTTAPSPWMRSTSPSGRPHAWRRRRNSSITIETRLQGGRVGGLRVRESRE